MNRVVMKILESAHAEGRSALLENEVYEILRAGGLDVPRYLYWPGSPESGLMEEVAAFLRDLPAEEVVLKIVSPQILHKSDVGGLAFSPNSPSEVLTRARDVWRETGQRAPAADRRGLLVMEKVAARGGLAGELLLSARQDPAFGPTLVLGLGGLLTEWFGSFSHGTSTVILQPGRVREGLLRLLPHMPVLSFLFRPSRIHAAPPLDLEDTAGKLEALGKIMTSLGTDVHDAPFTLEEIEVNPMLLSRDGRLVAVDGVGRFSERKVARPVRPIHKIRQLLEPRSALILGASSKGLNPGRIILRNLKNSEGIEYGRLYVVHPKEESIDGVRCLHSLDEVPEKVDMTVVSIPAEGARDSIRVLAEKDMTASIILIPGGFAETGKKGLEQEIIDILESSRSRPGQGPVLIGGNCLGVVSKKQYNTFFLPNYKLPFHDAPGDSLAAISQSGAYLVTLTSNLDGIILPRASISYGNQMDLTVCDFLEYYLGIDSVKVLACYVEGFKPLEGARFVELAARLGAQGKRVIAFKAGKTSLGAKAAQSHTASLAGDYAVARSLLQGAGVLVAETLNQFEDFTKVYTMLMDRAPAGAGEKRGEKADRTTDPGTGRRVAVISNAGFECSAVLDKLYNLVPAPLSEETRERLRACLPGIAHADNPVDATPMATTCQFIQAAEALLQDSSVDALLVSPVPVTPALDNLAPDPAGTHSENIHGPDSLPQQLLRMFRETKKPVVVAVDSGRLYDEFVMLLQRAGIPAYRKIDRASRALSALLTR